MAMRNNRHDAVREVQSLLGGSDLLYFRLGELLSGIRDNCSAGRGLWFDRMFVKNKFGLGYSKAMYLIRIYEKFSQARIGQRRLRGLDWSKAKEIARLETHELKGKFDSLSDFARKNTRQELIALIHEKCDVDTRKPRSARN